MFSTEIPTSRASSFFVIFCVLLGLTGLLDAEPVQQPLQSGKNIECTTLRQLIPYRTVRKCAERFVPKPASRFLDINWEYQSYAYSNMFGKVRLIPDLSCKNCHRPEMQAILKKLTAYKQKQSPGGSSEGESDAAWYLGKRSGSYHRSRPGYDGRYRSLSPFH